MLIIFDLDDTLIDTSGGITPYALENALRKMIASGLSVSSFEEALELLKRIDRMAISGGDALAEFVEILDGDKELFEIGKSELYSELPSDIPVFPLEGAVELLTELSQDHRLALVTIGKLPIQMGKLKKAGIDSALFSKIIASEEKKKKIFYQELMEDLRFASNEILVCGDRYTNDLAPAKDLGFKTVHMKWGRGLNVQLKNGDVDYQISTFSELKDIISHLTTFSAF